MIYFEGKEEETKARNFLFFFSKKEEKSHAISKTKDHRGFSSEIEEAQRNENFNLFFFFFWNEKQRWEIKNSTRWKGERKMKGRKEKIISNATWKEKRNRNDLKSVILEKIEVVAVPRWIVRLVNRLRMGDARNMVYNVLVLKAGQDRLSGTERVSLKGEAWTLSELVRLFSGQLAAKSETCVARLLVSPQLLWPVHGDVQTWRCGRSTGMPAWSSSSSGPRCCCPCRNIVNVPWEKE